ncbi:MAG: hypothetical protein HY000_20095 [Planctomycetes bacterium]|nr:hypothetical protein [Planctomycetota bacterium]
MATINCADEIHARRRRLAPAHVILQVARVPAIWHGALVGCVLYVAMGIYAHHTYQGSWFALFQPGLRFGVPALELSKGLRPYWEGGWDPMFYYYQSNDPFARTDAWKHIDRPPYRYQRIGVPLLAWASSRLLGYDITPPRFYHLIQIVLVAAGFAVLAEWLNQHGYSSLWGYGWLASTGVVYGLFAGMPDAVGDALFITAIIAALRGRLWLYVPAATLLCLVREAYGIFAAAIFAISICGHVRWAGSWGGRDQHCSLAGRSLERFFPRLYTLLPKSPSLRFEDSPVTWPRRILEGLDKLLRLPFRILCGPYAIGLRHVLALAVPCAVLFGWQMYVRSRFGQTGSEVSGHILDWPLIAIWKEFKTAVAMQWLREVVLKEVGLAIFMCGIAVVWGMRRRTAIAWPILCYFVLLTLMSSTVWFESSGYMKAMGSVLAAMALFLPWQNHWLVRCLLVGAALHGPYDNYRLKKDQFLMPFDEQQRTQYNGDHKLRPLPDDLFMKGKLANFSGHVAVGTVPDDLWKGDGYAGVFSFAHRAGIQIPVTITNHGAETWKNWPREGMNSINLCYVWLTPDGQWLNTGLRTPLVRPVAPGESLTQHVRVQVPAPGRYKLRIGLLQEGYDFFANLGGEQMLELDVVAPGRE